MAKYYQYPQSLKSKEQAGHHYLLIDSYESKNAIASGKQVSSIALYVPAGSLQTSYGADYEGLDQGALFGASGAKVREVVEGGGGIRGIVAAAVGGGSQEAARARGIVGLVNAASKLPGAGGNAPNVLSATTGLAVNNHMALVYRGPNQFRSHTFNFSFFPKNSDESDDVKEILNDLRNGMLPRYTGSGKTNGRLSSPFFKMPRMYELDLLIQGIGTNSYINDDMFPRNSKGDRIKHVITNMSINHDPNDVVSFHSNGAPVQTNMSLTFQETAFITSKDVVDDRFDQNLASNITNQAQARENARVRETNRRLSGVGNPPAQRVKTGLGGQNYEL